MPRADGDGAIGDGDKRIAAMLLRDAKLQAEIAEEEGTSAFLADHGHAPRINERLLQSELAQTRSFNKRCGVDAASLPKLGRSFESSEQRTATALDREYVRRAHELRESAKSVAAAAGGEIFCPGDWECPKCGASVYASKAQCFKCHTKRGGEGAMSRKRQRVGAEGSSLDIIAAVREEERQAEEEVEMCSSLLRPPPGHVRKSSASKPLKQVSAIGRHADAGAGKVDVWVTKKLRVRIVAGSGEFKQRHLRKGVVRRVDVSSGRVDVELDAQEGTAAETVKGVPQELLETVVSKTCKRVEIVRGPHRGMLAELLERSPKLNIAIVKMGRAHEEAELELPLDDVCEFV